MKSHKAKRSTEELIITYSCLACALVVAPFVFIRAMEGDYQLALIDALIVLGVISIAMLTERTANIQLARWLLCIFCATGACMSVYVKGAISVHWLYPVMVLSFFLLRVRYAFLINSIALALLLPIVFRDTEKDETVVIMGAIIISNIIAYIFASQTNHQRKLLAEIATIDYLTDAGNRRALSLKLKESIELKRRTETSISAILLDLDYFKKVNDSHGHAVGDELLIHLCQIIRTNIRLTDRLYRYGGEEFVVILNNSDLEAAFIIAEKLRKAVLLDKLMAEYRVTISLGVAELEEGETERQWLFRIDQALYQSKNSGRNKTSCAECKKINQAESNIRSIHKH